VALSVNPKKAIFAVDAALEALETASAADLVSVVKVGLYKLNAVELTLRLKAPGFKP
jgi:hypothetical protein